MKREYYIYIYILYCMKGGIPMLEVAARQTNDNRETPSDILEHVSVLYKYSVYNEYLVWRWEGTKHVIHTACLHQLECDNYGRCSKYTLCICQHITTHCAMLAYICCIKSTSMVCIASLQFCHLILHVDWWQGSTKRQASSLGHLHISGATEIIFKLFTPCILYQYIHSLQTTNCTISYTNKTDVTDMLIFVHQCNSMHRDTVHFRLSTTKMSEYIPPQPR